MEHQYDKIALIGAGTIGTALGNILAGTGKETILLHSVESHVVDNINKSHVNNKYFPGLQLHPGLRATTDASLLEHCEVIFLAIPSVVMMNYVKTISQNLPPATLLVNLAKGFGAGSKTIIECLQEEFPNPVCTMKGPSFAGEIINRMPTGFTVG